MEEEPLIELKLHSPYCSNGKCSEYLGLYERI